MTAPAPARASSPAHAGYGCAACRRPQEVGTVKNPTFPKNFATFFKNVATFGKMLKKIVDKFNIS
jgi:hypothetical protein